MKRTQQRRRGARTLRLLLFCSIADVVPPLAGLRSGSRPARTFIVLVEGGVHCVFLACLLSLPCFAFQYVGPSRRKLQRCSPIRGWFVVPSEYTVVVFVRAGPAFLSFPPSFLFRNVKIRRKQSSRAFSRFALLLFLLRRRRVFRVPFDYLSNSLFVPGVEYISAVFMNFSSVHYARGASRVCVGEEEFFFSLFSFFELSSPCVLGR